MSTPSAFLTKTIQGLTLLNTLVVPTGEVRLRFQIAPGTVSGLGIAGAQFSLLFGGAQFASGQTDANGELGIPIQQLLSGTVVVRIFDTDYNVSLHPGLQSPESLAGQQKRLDIMGYITGYQLGEFDNLSHRLRRDGTLLLHGVPVVESADRLRRRLELVTVVKIQRQEDLLRPEGDRLMAGHPARRCLEREGIVPGVAADRSAAARKGAATKGAAGRSAAAKKGARTRAAHAK